MNVFTYITDLRVSYRVVHSMYTLIPIVPIQLITMFNKLITILYRHRPLYTSNTLLKLSTETLSIKIAALPWQDRPPGTLFQHRYAAVIICYHVTVKIKLIIIMTYMWAARRVRLCLPLPPTPSSSPLPRG